MKIVLISTGSSADKRPEKVAQHLEKYEHKTEIIKNA